MSSRVSCNLDDMTPEALGFVQEILFAAGALEVYTIPIGMKEPPGHSPDLHVPLRR